VHHYIGFFVSKYKAVKVKVDGIKFDSKGEAEYYKHLLNQEKKGVLKILELQPKTYLTESRILYKPDFLILRDDREIYIDFKGIETPVFKLKKKLWKNYGLGILWLVKKSKLYFEVYEQIKKDC